MAFHEHDGCPGLEERDFSAANEPHFADEQLFIRAVDGIARSDSPSQRPAATTPSEMRPMQLLLVVIATAICVLGLTFLGMYLLNRSIDKTDL